MTPSIGAGRCGSIRDMDDATSAGRTPTDLSRQLEQARPDHPALARLHDRLQHDEAREITSYDRMHHRHNRH